MIQRQTETYHGMPVVREIREREIAKVPITGEELHQCILLHPRYVPKEVLHEIIKARVFVRGRSIDLFLEEPYIHEGKEHWILNYKGAGADADEELVIHPNLWWAATEHVLREETKKKWVPRSWGGYGRMWGTVITEDGRKEYTGEPLTTLHIPYTPHIAIHEIPFPIRECIRKTHKTQREDMPYLSQMIRACRTNIRCDRYGDNSVEIPAINVTGEEIADIDARIINAQKELINKGQVLHCEGNIRENRVLDGLLTDTENITIQSPRLNETSFIQRILSTSLHMILPEEQHEKYFEALGKRIPTVILPKYQQFGKHTTEENIEFILKAMLQRTYSTV